MGSACSTELEKETPEDSKATETMPHAKIFLSALQVQAGGLPVMMIPEMNNPLRQEVHSPFLRSHLRRSGSAGSGLHMLTKGSTAALLGRLVLLSSALAALLLCVATFLPAK